MIGDDAEHNSLAGSLLLADPGLPDPHFRRTVVLISAHSLAEGAMGVILNRPTGEALADLDPNLRYDQLGEVPVYEGGPVQPERILLGAWRWSGEGNVFRLFLGIDPQQARELKEDGATELRAFRGFAGWGEGQMEAEIATDSWTVMPITAETFGGVNGVALWKHLVKQVHPEWILEVERPDHPERN